MAAPKIGIRHYGNDQASREWIEILAIEGDTIALRFKERHEDTARLTSESSYWWTRGAWTHYYSETPPRPEWEVGDKVVTDWCGHSCLYYELDHKTESIEMGVSEPYWYARRFGSDGGVAPVAINESLFTGHYDK